MMENEDRFLAGFVGFALGFLFLAVAVLLWGNRVELDGHKVPRDLHCDKGEVIALVLGGVDCVEDPR
jgi:hypothetical protein